LARNEAQREFDERVERERRAALLEFREEWTLTSSIPKGDGGLR